jgi:hypothetical protein
MSCCITRQNSLSFLLPFPATATMEKGTLPTMENEVSSPARKQMAMVQERRVPRNRAFAIGFTVVAFLYFCLSVSRPFLFPRMVLPHNASLRKPCVESSKTLVPLEAHIMSKCPDAKVRWIQPLACCIG